MEKKSKQIQLLGIILIIIAIFKPISNVIILLVLGKGNWRLLWPNLYPIAKGFDEYPALGNALSNLYNICPIYQARIISILIAVIQTYIPFLCKLALLVSGIGFFFKKNIFRQLAVIALSIILLLGILELGLLILYFKHFYIDSLIVLMLFVWIVYYFTRSRVKEWFRKGKAG